VIAGITALAVIMFAIPLAIVVQRLYRSEAETALERDATRIAAVTPDDEIAHPRPVRLPKGLHPGLTVGIYRPSGERIAGDGPHDSPVTSDAADGRLHQATEHRSLVVSAPIPSDERPLSVVRVSMPYDPIDDRTKQAWLLMAALALLIVLLGTALARQQAARLARPLERLTQAAQALGDGDFTIRAKRSGVREAEEAELALEATADRLGSMLDRERSFSADVSHQLRTPLTGLLLGLESALERPGADLRSAIRTAIRRGEHLQDITEDLLRLARDAGPDRRRLDTPALLADLRDRWHGTLASAGRPLTIAVQQPLPEIHSMPSAIRQILDVLVDNAARHGRGRITVEAADVGSGLAIDVSDEGSGVTDTDAEDIFVRRNSTGNGHGIGLALARSLAEAEGGRLVLRRPAPPIFTLLLPASGDNGGDSS
jgi:signal transduction histidine kinase